MVCKDLTEQGSISPALVESCNLWSVTPGSLAAAGEVRNSLGQKTLLSKGCGWSGVGRGAENLPEGAENLRIGHSSKGFQVLGVNRYEERTMGNWFPWAEAHK